MDRIVVSHNTRELMERRFLMHESLYKGHLKLTRLLPCPPTGTWNLHPPGSRVQ